MILKDRDMPDERDMPGVPSRTGLPTVVHEGIVKIGAMEIKVLQLSSGERVIEEESMRALLSVLFGDAQ